VIEYKENERPFAEINGFNMNNLSERLGQEPLEYPPILDKNPDLIISDDLKFKTK